MRRAARHLEQAAQERLQEIAWHGKQGPANPDETYQVQVDNLNLVQQVEELKAITKKAAFLVIPVAGGS